MPENQPRPEMTGEDLSPEQRAEVAKLLRKVADRLEHPESEGTQVYALLLVAATSEGVIGASTTNQGVPVTVFAPFHVAALHLLAQIIETACAPAQNTAANPVVGRVVSGGDA